MGVQERGRAVPEPLLPVQLATVEVRAGGERALLVALVEDAARLAMRTPRTVEGRQARAWMIAPDDGRWGSFSFACDQLGWDVDAMRERLARVLPKRAQRRLARVRGGGHLPLVRATA